MLHSIRETMREKRLLHTMGMMVITVMLISTLAFSALFRWYTNDALAPKIMQQNEAMLNINTAAFDDILSQCIRVSVAMENDRFFSAEYIATRATAFIDIRKKLSDFASLIAGVEDIFFVSQSHRQIYTAQGMYNPAFFSPSLGKRAGVHTQVFYDNLRFGRQAYLATAYTDSLLFENNNNVIEYIVPIQYGKGVAGFRIYAAPLLSGNADMTLILEDGAGQLLYHSGLSASQAEWVLQAALYQAEPSGTLDVDGDRFFYAIQSSAASGARLLYLIPYGAYTSEIRAMNQLFIGTCAAVLALCSLLGTLLLRYAYAPVRRMQQTLAGTPVEIPPGLNEAESVHYALSALGNQYDALSQSHRAVRRAQVLRRLLARDTGGDFLAGCRDADIRLEGRHLMVMLLSVSVEDEARAGQMVEDAAFLLSRGQEVVFMDYARRLSFVLLLLSDRPVARDYLVSVADHLNMKHGRVFSLGISAPYEDYRQSHHAFQQARAAVRACDRNDTSYCLFEALQNPWEQAAPYPRTEIDGLADAIANRRPEQIVTLSEVLIRSVREESQCSLTFCLCYDIANTMLHAARLNPILAAKLNESPRFAYETIEFLSIGDFSDFIHALTRLIVDNLDLCPDLCRDVDVYIEDHITDANLYAETLAAHFQVSVQKINRLYKDRTGQTITAYIAQRRHAYIKRMLITSDMSIQALALQMGYSQASSFVRYFKQEEGMPPGEYRSRYCRREEAPGIMGIEADQPAGG